MILPLATGTSSTTTTAVMKSSTSETWAYSVIFDDSTTPTGVYVFGYYNIPSSSSEGLMISHFSLTGTKSWEFKSTAGIAYNGIKHQSLALN